MDILRTGGVHVPKFGVARTPEEAMKVAKELKCSDFVVKAQVLAGGRGRGKFSSGLKGGVKIVFSADEVYEISKQMLNQKLVTAQTGPQGVLCKEVMIVERLFPRREYYFTLMMERAYNGPVIIASSQGGMAIEEVARDSPDAIVTQPIDIEKGLTQELAIGIVKRLGFHPASHEQV